MTGPTVPPTAATEVAGPEPWQPRQIAALAIVAVCGVLVALVQTLLIPVMGDIQRDTGASTGDVSWLLTSTLLVAAVAVPVMGRLGDMVGKRRMLMVAAGALALGSLICALTSDLAVLIVGRAITGVSAAAIPLGISLIGQVLSPRRAAGGIALVSATLGIGGALGLPMAALIAEHADYHVLFWICAAGGALAVVGVAFAVEAPAERRAAERFDFGGTALLAAALVCLLLPLAQANRWGWGDPRTLSLLVASVVLVVVFVLAERRTRSPLVDVRSNARPGLLLTNVASLCVGFALFASLIGTASYVQAPPESGYGFGKSVLVSGLAMLPSGVAMLLLSPVSARLTNRHGPRLTLALGASIVAVGFLMRIVLVDEFWMILLGTTVAGAGTGIAYAAMPSIIMRNADPRELAAANGLNTLFRSVGSSLSSAAGGTLLASQTITLAGTALPSLGAYRTLFAICAGAALVGAAIALVVPMNPAADEVPAGAEAVPAGA